MTTTRCYALPSPESLVQDLLAKATRGVDPDSPDAFARIFANIMALVPWWPLFWFTVLCVAVGAALGWWRRRIWLGIALALVLGPIGWFTLWAFPAGAEKKKRAERATAKTPSSRTR